MNNAHGHTVTIDRNGEVKVLKTNYTIARSVGTVVRMTVSETGNSTPAWRAKRKFVKAQKVCDTQREAIAWLADVVR